MIFRLTTCGIKKQEAVGLQSGNGEMAGSRKSEVVIQTGVLVPAFVGGRISTRAPRSFNSIKEAPEI
ncbi:hypothetical protein DN748_11850 [Sinomicrobium soli]|nr:hypothetical protein DN748_11850 [Sinomicrobium sp. N-1-3-6]